MLHVIAISKRLNSAKKFDTYVYKNGMIYLYSSQGSIQGEWKYEDKIREIAMLVDNGNFDWVDIYIKNGQKVWRQDEEFYVDNKRVESFNKLSEDDFSKIGPVTSKIYNEFIRSRDKKNIDLRKFVKETFSEGYFAKKIADVIEDIFDYSLDETDLNNLDKQIIVRVKIEGYEFIINFIKNILASKMPNADNYCEKFLSRVFMLESQNFIKVETDNYITI